MDGKYYAPSGTTGFRWLESEMISDDIFDLVDESFYRTMVDDRIADISQYGDFEWFASDDPYIGPDPLPDFMNVPEGMDEEIPWD